MHNLTQYITKNLSTIRIMVFSPLIRRIISFFTVNRWVCLIIWCFFYTPQAKGQILSKIFKIDTASRGNYVVLDSITNNRFFLSRKLTSPTLAGKYGENKTRYRSNGNLNLGVGHTYEWFNLNIGVNFGFINNDNDIRGRTRFLDLHTQIIGRPFIINFFGQFYRGVHLIPDSGRNPPGKPYEQRPDIYTRLVGGTVYFVPNWRKFSFAAAITQRDWQLKSAGSPLYGVEFFWGSVRSDTALLPLAERKNYKRSDFNHVQNLEIAAGVGYGYTLVVAKHWFLHGSATCGWSLGNFSERTRNQPLNNHLYIRPNFLTRASFGYNSNRFNAALFAFMAKNISGNDQMSLIITTTNFRATFAYRIPARGKFKDKYQRLLALNPTWKNLPPKDSH